MKDSMATVFIIFTVLLMIPTRSIAQSDGFYTVVDSEPQAPYEWLEIEGEVVEDPDDDQIIGPVIPGFVFRFYNGIYDRLYISTNGFILFDEPLESGCCQPEHIPLLPGDSKLNGIISFAWSDLNPSLGGEIRWEVTGSYPERVFVVEFNGIPHQGSLSAWPISVQAVLYEKDGTIKFNYRDDGDYPFPVVIGIDEPGRGQGGIEYFYGGFNEIDLNEKSVAFRPERNIRIIPETINTIGEGSSFQFRVRVYQKDPSSDYTIMWDTDNDGQYDMNDVTEFFVDATSIDGPYEIPVSIYVEDTRGNTDILDTTIFVENEPPQIISNPPESVTPGTTFIYEVETYDPAGSSDPVNIGIARGPVGMVIDGNTVRWEVPQDAQPGDRWQVLIIAYDDDGGYTRQYFQIQVADVNSLPEAPEIVYPSMVTVPVAQPELVVENVDTTGEAYYYFTVDESPEFNSSHKIESGPVPEGESRTKWKIPSPLKNDTRYYWKVWVEDTRGIGPASSTYFDVRLNEVIEEQNGCSCRITNRTTVSLFNLLDTIVFYMINFQKE